MKVIYEKEVSPGLMIGAYIEGDSLVIKESYKLEKVLKPVNDLIDGGIDKLEKLIPGDWDKVLLDSAKAEAKAQLIKLLSE